MDLNQLWNYIELHIQPSHQMQLHTAYLKHRYSTNVKSKLNLEKEKKKFFCTLTRHYLKKDTIFENIIEILIMIPNQLSLIY